MNAPDDPHLALARRLRGLRVGGMSGLPITQGQLAEAFSRREPASVPLISSWENSRKPVTPPVNRLDAYATFFATERSVASRPYRLLTPSELTDDERRRHDGLLRELAELRNAAVGSTDTQTDSLWHFSSDQNITIICAELPEDLRLQMPYADPASPDFVKLYQFTDLDALIEIYGHIRAVNPSNRVSISAPSESRGDLFTAHLVVLGGVDFNMITRDLLRLIEIPVRQMARDVPTDMGGFEVGEGQEVATFKPVLQKHGDQNELVEDVGHFYRGPNPLNKERTVTICSGMFGRGTLGAVRALTDRMFSGRNEEYVTEHLGRQRFSIISRVRILNGEVVTPDWTRSSIRLHEWPKESIEHAGARQ